MLSPLTWLLLALLLVLAGCRWRHRVRWLAPAGVGLAVVATVAMTPWAANSLVAWLESPRGSPAFCTGSPPSAAVVLAAGLDAPPAARTEPSMLDLASRRRIERAVAWWHERPGRTLVVAGGPQRDGSATSRLMALHARRLGLPASALRTEERSDSTWRNAQELAALQPRLPRRVVLVTSAMHMRRARFALERAGFEVCPLATDSRHVPFGLPGYVLPGSSALAKTEAALHELVGLGYYRWRDWRSGAPGA